MDFDLDLGLALHDQYSTKDFDDHKKIENKKKKMESKIYLSLSLGPSKDDDEESCDQNLLTSPSIESSFSNSMNMMKKDIVDEDGNSRKKLRLKKEQSEILEENFREHSTLNQKQKQELAERLTLQARQVEVWFQNRRARTKLKQTESDYEVLKKCCETLTEENKKLKKELQELKSMQTLAAAPFYMQIPAATLTICPLCGNNNNGSSPTTALIIGSKAQ